MKGIKIEQSPSEEKLKERALILVNRKISEIDGLINIIRIKGIKVDYSDIEDYRTKVKDFVEAKNYGSHELTAYNENLLKRVAELKKRVMERTKITEEELDARLNPGEFEV